MTNIINHSDLQDYISHECYKRTPTGYQYIERQLYHKQLETFSEANITNNCITIIRRKPAKDPTKECRKLSPSQLANLSKPRYTGLMTTSAMYRLKKSFDSLIFNSRPFDTIDPETKKPRKARMVAWTFTLPDTVLIDGKQMWALFKSFKWTLVRKGISFPYVAKLEFHKNGQPHLHVDVTEYLNYDVMYSTWKHTLDTSCLLDDWYNDHSGQDIQGCKFQYLWTDNQCEDYLWSYFKKASQNSTPAGCRIWSCSNDHKNPQNRRIYMDDNQSNLLRRATSTGQCRYYEKSVPVVQKPKYIRYKLTRHSPKIPSQPSPLKPSVYREQRIQCDVKREHVVFRRWKFKSHEDLLQFLTIYNKRIVSDHKKRYRSGQAPPDDRWFIFDRKFMFTPLMLEEDYVQKVDNFICPESGHEVPLPYEKENYTQGCLFREEAS